MNLSLSSIFVEQSQSSVTFTYTDLQADFNNIIKRQEKY